MEKMDFCRLCLVNSMTAPVLQTTDMMEQTMRKFNILYLKADATIDGLNGVCESCWNRIDEFRQFSVHVENIHTSYVDHFLKEDGTFSEFDNVAQYYGLVDDIHNLYAKQLMKCDGGVDDNDEKKFQYIQPFYMIDVDEGTTKHTPADDVESIDLTAMECDQLAAEPDDVKNEPMNSNLCQEDDIMNTISDSCDISTYHQNSRTVAATNERKTKSTNKIVSKKKKKKKAQKPQKPQPSIASEFGDADAQSALLLKHFELKCELCSEHQFNTFADLQRHFWAEHEQSGYMRCCDRKWRRLSRILQHCRWHENPEAWKCPDCNKCFQDNVCLRDHITSTHIPRNDCTYSCNQCNRAFAKRHLLNTHLKMKHTMKEERPFVCPEENCEQRFVLPANLRMHVEKVHNNGDSAVCDICARFFKCSKSYERHYQVMHTNIDQRVQCDLCKKWFKHLDTLKEHIRRHNAASATCKHCGRVSSNKKSLRLHIRNVHADIDSSVKKRNEFPCTICEKFFKKKQTLREHMSLHSGEAFLYTCTFCPKTFRSSANMYAHRKRNHPKEYVEKCVLPKTQKV